MTLQEMVQEFNTAYKPTEIQEVPTIPNETSMKLWGDLMIEELQELAVAHNSKDPVEFLDAIADLLYVTAQQANLNGWPIDAALEEVHQSNMSKLGEDGKPIIREDGKVLKGPYFEGPDLTSLVVGSVVEKGQ